MSHETFKLIEGVKDSVELIGLIKDIPKENISIIDGMQRTTALIESRKTNLNGVHDLKLRVEYWISTSTSSLIYRMLVLNTGQVPWNLRRQIEVVFKSLIEEVNQRVNNIDVIEIGDLKRRSNPGQFHADHVVELFMVFGARKEKVDTQERLADEFTRLDFIQATSYPEFTHIFCEVLACLRVCRHRIG